MKWRGFHVKSLEGACKLHEAFCPRLTSRERLLAANAITPVAGANAALLKSLR